VSRSARTTTSAAVLTAAVLVSFLLVVAVVVGSGELLGLAERSDGSTSLDSSISAWIVAHRAPWMTTLARGASVVGSQVTLLPLVAIIAAVLLRRRRLALAGRLVVGWTGAIGIYSLAKYFVNRHRPPTAIWLTRATGSSFPSGHATQSLSTFVVAALVAVLVVPTTRRAAIVLALVLSAAVGWSRIYLGVHWATDVIAGWLAGAAWAAVVLTARRDV
jgi:membrane-associated phospholipid phosphatase